MKQQNTYVFCRTCSTTNQVVEQVIRGTIILRLNLFLLQGNLGYFKEDNPVETLIVVIAVALIIFMVSVISFFRKRMNSKSLTGTKGKTQVTPRNFNLFTLHSIAAAYGLNRQQMKFLEFIFRSESVSEPKRVMESSDSLDRYFKRAYKHIERNAENDEVAQDQIYKLFSLRTAIELGRNSRSSPPPRLEENTQAVIILGKDNYTVKVLAVKEKNILVSLPTQLGNAVKIDKGKEVILSFFNESNTGFSILGETGGILPTSRGQSLQIIHSGKAKPLIKRLHRRKEVSLRCDFFLVHIKEAATKKKSARLIVDEKRFNGMIVDISIGGCALQSSAAVQPGDRLKIVISYSHYSISVLGQILRINRSGGASSTLHIKFLKIPRRAFNSINTLVFAYNDK